MVLTGAVCNTVGDNGWGDIRTAGSVRAVADTVCEVDVAAEASSIGGTATKGWSKTKHVGDAGLLEGVNIVLVMQTVPRSKWQQAQDWRELNGRSRDQCLN